MIHKTYEDYWSITNAFTDYNGKNFLKTLAICVHFIDKNQTEPYSDDKYSALQNEIQASLNINLISVRKAINQLVKLGFINARLRSHPLDTAEYLRAKTNRKRQSLLSKIVYSNSSLNRSVSEDSGLNQLNFLIRTLVENGKLHKKDIIALMLVDIGSIEKGYLTGEEMDLYVQKAEEIGFVERKYNQVSYLFNLLGKLDDIVFVEDELYFEEDAKNIFGDELKEERRTRDPYLHRLYKNQLGEDSNVIFGKIACMVEQLPYPVLIASHIKPFIKSSFTEAYDVNNGLLLSKNIDSLFDLGYITFDDEGIIICSNILSEDVQVFVKKYALESIFLNDKRKEYLQYHRNNVFEKRFKNK